MIEILLRTDLRFNYANFFSSVNNETSREFPIIPYPVTFVKTLLKYTVISFFIVFHLGRMQFYIDCFGNVYLLDDMSHLKVIGERIQRNVTRLIWIKPDPMFLSTKSNICGNETDLVTFSLKICIQTNNKIFCRNLCRID